MSYATTVRDGFARDEALKRRNGAVRQALGLAPQPRPDTEQAAEQKTDDKPSEQPTSSRA